MTKTVAALLVVILGARRYKIVLEFGKHSVKV